MDGSKPGGLLASFGTAAVISLGAALAQDIVPKSAKEFLVFFRVRHRLPGHRAFSGLFNDVSRYDLSKLTNLMELRQMPAVEQQRVFYKIYRKHSSETRVAHYSFRYLAWRDVSSTITLLSLVTFPVFISVGGVSKIPAASAVFAGCALGFLLSASAARMMANELVHQVLTAETMGRAHAVTK